MSDGVLDLPEFDLLRKEFAANPQWRLLQNAVAETPVDKIALDREIVTTTTPTVSNLLDRWKVTNQKKSGRCWMFAGLNLLRPGAMDRLGLTEFEFSQNFPMFYDKLERANYFCEAMIELADREADDRTVAYLLDSVLGDGGQWNMFAALVAKHGLVPKQAMPETQSSSSTAQMNAALRTVLRTATPRLRSFGSDLAAAREAKRDVLSAVHRILSIHLGTPPQSFEWQWTDDDKQFHRAGSLTPQEFAREYVTLPMDEYVCLVDDPRPSSPRGRTFTVDYLGNVVGAPPVIYLNVEPALLRDLARDAIVGGEPVWFGCDVGKQLDRERGLWDARLYDYESVYDTAFDLDKAGRLTYHETEMTHAMLFTGVDVDDAGQARKWRVENSWGDEHGEKGFYTMNDSWFHEYVFEIAARRDRLPQHLQAALDEEPIVLPAWDPMGALAR